MEIKNSYSDLIALKGRVTPEDAILIEKAAAALKSMKAIDIITRTKEFASNYKVELIKNELEGWDNETAEG